MAQLMFPNIVDAMNAGVDRGNQVAFNRLAGQYVDDPSNNSALLGQAAQINPGAALGIQNAVQTQQANQVQQQHSQQMMQLQKIGGAARYMATALKSNNPAQIDGAWQNVRPFLEQLTGKQTPPTWDPNMEPALYDVIAKTSQAFPDDNKLNVLNAGARLVTGQGQTVASAPFKPEAPKTENGYQLTLGPDGKYIGAQIPLQDGGTLSQAVIDQAAAKKSAVMAVGGNGGANQDGLTPDALQMLSTAGQAGYTIPTPSFGMGGAKGKNMRAEYYNQLAANIKANGGDYGAAVQQMQFGQSGMKGVNAAQRLYGMTSANEAAVEAQAPIIQGLAQKVNGTGVPVFNRWLQAGQIGLQGDPDVTNFNKSTGEFVEEYAKVMSGSPSGAATDRAASFAHDQLYSSMNPQQFQARLQNMIDMMHARRSGQLHGINDQISGLANRGAAPSSQQEAPVQDWQADLAKYGAH